MGSDHNRRQFYTVLEERLGEGPATTLMELLPPVGWGDVARQSDITALRGEMAELRGELRGEMAELRTELRGEMAEVRGQMAELRAELRGEMAELRTELRGEMGEVRGEMARLTGRIDAQVPKFVLANVPVMFGVGGLVLAAARLA